MTDTIRQRVIQLLPAMQRAAYRFDLDGAVERDDLVQDMALFLLEHGSEIRFDGAAIMCALRRAMNTTLSESRRRNRRTNLDDDSVGIDGSAEDAMHASEARAALEQAIACLTPADQRAVRNLLAQMDLPATPSRKRQMRRERARLVGALVAVAGAPT